MAKKKTSTRKTTKKKTASKKRSTRRSGKGSTGQAAPTRPTKPASGRQTRAVIGIVLNLIIMPGLGTIVGGDTRTGLWQIFLVIVGAVTAAWLVGFILIFAAWVWAIVSSVEQLQRAY